MPPLYEEAARILLFLTRAGLPLPPAERVHELVTTLAELLVDPLIDVTGFSHHDKAAWIMALIETNFLCPALGRNRPKPIAVLGTCIANLEAAGICPASPRRPAGQK